MAQCPRCKEDMPLLSKICPVCGYTIDGSETSLSADEFAQRLETDLFNLKQIPEPTFMQSMMQLVFVVFPLIAIYSLALALISEAGMFWILFLIMSGLSIWAILKKAKGTLGNDKFNNEFKKLKNEFEYNQRLARHSYGKNKEVAALMNDIATQISEMEKKRKTASVRNVIIWGLILLLFFGLAARGVFSLNKVLNEVPAQTEQEESILD